MNSCVLMAQVVKGPELRYTQENQTPLAQMLVQFSGQRPEDVPATLKVVGWGNLAGEMQENYLEGDRVIIQGRLSTNRIDRPEGFKETRAELIASRIYKITTLEDYSSESSADPSKVVPISAKNSPSPTMESNPPQADSEFNTPDLDSEMTPANLDDIPF